MPTHGVSGIYAHLRGAHSGMRELEARDYPRGIRTPGGIRTHGESVPPGAIRTSCSSQKLATTRRYPVP
jgi:hypothetical protein